MLTLLALTVIAYGGWRLARAIDNLLHRLPRSNDDMGFF